MEKTKNKKCKCEDNSKKECECKECHCDENVIKLKETEDKLLRLQAEFMNYQNRREKELETLFKYEGEGVIKEILKVVDNFERAISMDDDDLSDEVSKFLSGFKMIYTSLINMLSELEVTEIDVDGKEFDPTIAEAVLVEEDKTKPAGVVLEVLQKGYKYKDKVIRPAMVKVNK